MPHFFEAPILQINRFYTGLITLRNPLAIPIRIIGRRIIELYDALIDGSNVEITNRLTLQRRPGYIPYNTVPLNGVPLGFYSFKQFTGTNQIFQIVDTTTNVYYHQPGAVSPTSLVSKGGTTQTTFKSVGSYLYMANASFAKKWDGGLNQGVTTWGISVTSAQNSTGFTSAGLGVDGGGGGVVWTNPGNVSSAGSYASAALTAFSTTSNALQATQFGFTLAASEVVTGIEVIFDDGGNVNFTLQLLLNGLPAGTPKTYLNLGGPSTGFVLGSQFDTWGIAISATQINQTNFGVQIIANGASTEQIKHVQIAIFGTGGPSVSTSGTGLTGTYQYVFAYGNSFSGHVSTASPPSNSITVTNQGVQVNLTASSDTQVNQIRVFRTTNGSSIPFFEIPTSPYPNTSMNIVDAAADSALLLNQAPLAHSNDPPPTGLSGPEWYAGRLWGFVGNKLYFAGGPDTTLGNGQEAWPPANVFVLPTSIARLVPLPTGLLVVTLDTLYIVRGIDLLSFTVNEFARDIGAQQYNAVDTDGSYVYLYTSDRQFLVLGPNGFDETGHNIGNQFDAVDPTQAYVAVHRSGSQDNTLFISDGSTLMYSYSLKQQAWNPRQIPVGGVRAITSMEITPGNYKFLLGQPTAGKVIAQRDYTTFSDLGQEYTAFMTFGSIPIADMGTLAQLGNVSLQLGATGSLPIVSILPQETSGTFTSLGTPASNEPPELPPSQSYVAQRWSMKKGVNLPEYMNNFLLKIAWPDESFQNELLGFAVYGTQITGGTQVTGTLPQLQGGVGAQV